MEACAGPAKAVRGGRSSRVFGDSAVPAAPVTFVCRARCQQPSCLLQMGHATVLYPLRVPFCSWSSPGPCSLLRRWLETPKWFRTALGGWQQQGHPNQRIFSEGSGGLLGHVHHHACPHAPILVPTWCHHGPKASGLRLASVPVPLLAACGGGMEPVGPEAASHGWGDGSGVAAPG